MIIADIIVYRFRSLLLVCFSVILILLGFSYTINWGSTEFSKLSAYECGFQPFSTIDKSFTISYFRISLIFVIFDIEIIFLVPLVDNIFFIKIPFETFMCVFLLLNLLLLGWIYEWYNKIIIFFFLFSFNTIKKYPKKLNVENFDFVKRKEIFVKRKEKNLDIRNWDYNFEVCISYLTRENCIEVEVDSRTNNFVFTEWPGIEQWRFFLPQLKVAFPYIQFDKIFSEDYSKSVEAAEGWVEGWINEGNKRDFFDNYSYFGRPNRYSDKTEFLGLRILNKFYNYVPLISTIIIFIIYIVTFLSVFIYFTYLLSLSFSLVKVKFFLRRLPTIIIGNILYGFENLWWNHYYFIIILRYVRIPILVVFIYCVVVKIIGFGSHPLDYTYRKKRAELASVHYRETIYGSIGIKNVKNVIFTKNSGLILIKPKIVLRFFPRRVIFSYFCYIISIIFLRYATFNNLRYFSISVWLLVIFFWVRTFVLRINIYQNFPLNDQIVSYIRKFKCYVISLFLFVRIAICWLLIRQLYFEIVLYFGSYFLVELGIVDIGTGSTNGFYTDHQGTVDSQRLKLENLMDMHTFYPPLLNGVDLYKHYDGFEHRKRLNIPKFSNKIFITEAILFIRKNEGRYYEEAIEARKIYNEERVSGYIDESSLIGIESLVVEDEPYLTEWFAQELRRQKLFAKENFGILSIRQNRYENSKHFPFFEVWYEQQFCTKNEYWFF